ncbi:hypothetical protein PENARI_c003G07028 [Penicillium arizonense]|uniref:Cyclin-dependent kinases regulatory subunit n=1 Tax=Penicillium arizonense TaxID=1835702 RepID=A0A1F5LTE9_PENAI|nr:hypothetical protein PENARI_c003G07028 [Penicillium arizonense]OGE56435.1 hypothetical protein PENARI_c003G07028 [Penicillium arizonense]
MTPQACSPTIFPSPAKQSGACSTRFLSTSRPSQFTPGPPSTAILSTRATFSKAAPPPSSSVAATCEHYPNSTKIQSATLFPMDIDPARRNKKPRLLLESEREKLDEFVDSIHYSARYNDDKFEYRHVQLPKNMLKKIPTDYFDSSKGTLKLLWEEEWRALGITQSLGWEHYEVHEPEPHILLFKRPLNYQPPLQQ